MRTGPTVASRSSASRSPVDSRAYDRIRRPATRTADASGDSCVYGPDVVAARSPSVLVLRFPRVTPRLPRSAWASSLASRCRRFPCVRAGLLRKLGLGLQRPSIPARKGTTPALARVSPSVRRFPRRRAASWETTWSAASPRRFPHVRDGVARWAGHVNAPRARMRAGLVLPSSSARVGRRFPCPRDGRRGRRDHAPHDPEIPVRTGGPSWPGNVSPLCSLLT